MSVAGFVFKDEWRGDVVVGFTSVAPPTTAVETVKLPMVVLLTSVVWGVWEVAIDGRLELIVDAEVIFADDFIDRVVLFDTDKAVLFVVKRCNVVDCELDFNKKVVPVVDDGMVVFVETLNGILEDHVLDFDDILVTIVDNGFSVLVDSCELDPVTFLVIIVETCLVLLVWRRGDVFGDGKLDSDVIWIVLVDDCLVLLVDRWVEIVDDGELDFDAIWVDIVDVCLLILVDRWVDIFDDVELEFDGIWVGIVDVCFFILVDRRADIFDDGVLDFDVIWFVIFDDCLDVLFEKRVDIFDDVEWGFGEICVVIVVSGIRVLVDRVAVVFDECDVETVDEGNVFFVQRVAIVDVVLDSEDCRVVIVVNGVVFFGELVELFFDSVFDSNVIWVVSCVESVCFFVDRLVCIVDGAFFTDDERVVSIGDDFLDFDDKLVDVVEDCVNNFVERKDDDLINGVVDCVVDFDVDVVAGGVLVFVDLVVDVVDDCVVEFGFTVALDETLVNFVVADIFWFVVLNFDREVNFDKTVDVDVVKFSVCIDDIIDFVVNSAVDEGITLLEFEVCEEFDDLALVVKIKVGCVKSCVDFEDCEDNFVATLVDDFVECILDLGITLVDCVDNTVFDVGIFCEVLFFDGLLADDVEDGFWVVVCLTLQSLPV